MSLELGQRVLFTVGALLVYRLGTYIPLPGIDPTVLAQVFRAQAGGVLGVVNVFSGGGIQRFAVFALGITPLLSAATILQLLGIVLPRLKALRNQGDRGRRAMVAYTRYLTLFMAAAQAYAISGGLEGVPGLVTEPGSLFRLATTLTLTGGTMFLVWLCEQITARGIGNGLSLFLSLGIVVALPSAIATMLELGRRGLFSTDRIVLLAVLAVALTGLIVFMELARRRLIVVFPRRQVGVRMIEGQSDLRLKLNSAGVIPAIMASWLLLVPLMLATFGIGRGAGWWGAIIGQFGHGQPLFMVFYAVAIVLCVLFYTAYVLDPGEAAETLKAHGGMIPGLEPGEATAEYLDYVLSRTTLIGAIYLALVCLVPEALISYAQVPFYFGGMSLLVVVCTVLDIAAQVRGAALTRVGG